MRERGDSARGLPSVFFSASLRPPVGFLLCLAFAGCSRTPQPLADPNLAAEIRQIKAIDNHAHPVRWVVPGEKPDRGFDALPVDSMEPESDPVALRPGSPALAEASHALYGGQSKAQVMAAKREQYPAWVLDQIGVETMLANRVEMGRSIQPPRFRWVAYADALIFPLDNTALAARTPDRKGFFALEDQLRAHYLEAVGLNHIPSTLAEYAARVVTPTLERQKQGGAIGEKFEAAYLRSLAFDPVDEATAARIYARFAVPVYRRRVRPPGNGSAHPHHGRSGWILRRGRRQSTEPRICLERSRSAQDAFCHAARRLAFHP